VDIYFRLTTAVAKTPPTKPPRWAFQSIPGITKGITRFKAINPRPSFKLAPIRLPITSSAPKRPKIMPEEPTAIEVSGLKRKEVREPNNKDVIKIKMYLFLPR